MDFAGQRVEVTEVSGQNIDKFILFYFYNLKATGKSIVGVLRTMSQSLYEKSKTVLHKCIFSLEAVLLLNFNGGNVFIFSPQYSVFLTKIH